MSSKKGSKIASASASASASKSSLLIKEVLPAPPLLSGESRLYFVKITKKDKSDKKPLSIPLFYKRGFFLEGESEATKFSSISDIKSRLEKTEFKNSEIVIVPTSRFRNLKVK